MPTDCYNTKLQAKAFRLKAFSPSTANTTHRPTPIHRFCCMQSTHHCLPALRAVKLPPGRVRLRIRQGIFKSKDLIQTNFLNYVPRRLIIRNECSPRVFSNRPKPKPADYSTAIRHVFCGRRSPRHVNRSNSI